MLGNVVSRQQDIDKPRASTALIDHVIKNWQKDLSNEKAPTLLKQDEIWEEFWLYASNTKMWCPRLCAIRAMNPRINEIVKAEIAWSLEYGKAVHCVFQNSVLRTLGPDFLGGWEADGESLITENVVDDGEHRSIERGWRPQPEEGEWKYIEPKIRMPEYRIVTKLDGIIRVEKDLEVFELKTEKEQARDGLNPVFGGEARSYHVEQVQLNMWASGLRTSRLVYMFKDNPFFRNSFIEHIIPYDEIIVQRLKYKAARCVEAVEMCDRFKNEIGVHLYPYFKSQDEFDEWIDEQIPRHSDCKLKSKGKAANCPGRHVCFPPGYRKKK